MARIAVLMSTYNGADYLRPQLESLCAQRGVEVELFVRDDGSSDHTLAILREYAERWPALRALASGRNLGPALSFMKLLRSVPRDFDYYAFSDQDDVWLAHKLDRAQGRLAPVADARPALYCSRVMRVDAQLRELGTTRLDEDSRFEHLLFENIAYGCTMLMNRRAHELLAAVTPDGRMAMHDWWCALVVSAFGSVLYDREPGILYRQHGRNTVGAQHSHLGDALRHLRVFAKKPASLYPIHEQAALLLELYGERLPSVRQRLLAQLVRSKRSAAARARYALSGPVVRSRAVDALVARGLILTGWY